MVVLTGRDARFAVRIAALRDARSLSQQQLADRIGIGRSALAEIERGRRKVTVGEAFAICAALVISVHDLYWSDQPLMLSTPIAD